MFRTPSETAMWTTLQPCQGDGGPSVNANTLGDIVETRCEALDSTMLTSPTIGTNNGQIQTVFSDLEDCWRDNTRDDDTPFLFGTRPWTVKLPIINCLDMQNQTCAQVLSIGEFNILWINSSPSDYQYPVRMDEIVVENIANPDEPPIYERKSWPTYGEPSESDDSWNEVMDSDGNTVYLEEDDGEPLTLLNTYHGGDFYQASDWPDPAAEATVADLWTPEESWSNQKKNRSTDLREGFWGDFVDHYDLVMIDPDNPDGTIDAEYDQKTLYFIPDCQSHSPAGGSGIHNFATLAKRPKLVK